MWLSDLRILCLGAALLLTGCGFRPLYGPATVSQGDVSASLRHVYVASIPERAGVWLRRHLETALAPHGPDLPAMHTLCVKIQNDARAKGFRRDGSAAATGIQCTAHFQLREHATNRVVLEDRVSANSSYMMANSAVRAALATPVAAEAASDNAIAFLSQLIAERLAAYFVAQQKEQHG